MNADVSIPRKRRRLSPVMLDDAARDTLTKRIEHTWQKYYHKYYSCASTNPEIVLEMQKEYLRSYRGFFKEDPYFECYYTKVARPEDLREVLTLRIDRGSPGPDPNAVYSPHEHIVPAPVLSTKSDSSNTVKDTTKTSLDIEEVALGQDSVATPEKSKQVDLPKKVIKSNKPHEKKMVETKDLASTPTPVEQKQSDNFSVGYAGENPKNSQEDEVRLIAQQLLQAAKRSEKATLPPPVSSHTRVVGDNDGESLSSQGQWSSETLAIKEQSKELASSNINPFSSEGGVFPEFKELSSVTEPVITSTTQGFPVDKPSVEGKVKSVMDRLGAQRREGNGFGQGSTHSQTRNSQNEFLKKDDRGNRRDAPTSRGHNTLPYKSHTSSGANKRSVSEKSSVTSRLGPPSKQAKPASENVPQVRNPSAVNKIAASSPYVKIVGYFNTCIHQCRAYSFLDV